MPRGLDLHSTGIDAVISLILERNARRYQDF